MVQPKQERADSNESATTYPEGGSQAWATVLGAFLINFCGFGYTTSFGVYQDFYVREYLPQSSSSAISWIGSVNALLVISMGLFVGRLYDRGHFQLLVYGGCLLQVFSIFMLSLCKRDQLYQIFLVQGLGLGIGAGIAYLPSIAVASHYFHKRRALAMSIVASGSSFGAVMHPIMLNNTLHNSSLGFGNSVRASAALISGLLLVACLLMRPRLQPSAHDPEFWNSLWRFRDDKAYVLATLGMATFSVAFYFPLFFLQLDAVTHGVDRTLSFYSLVIMNAASFAGRLTPGFFAHTLGVANMVSGAAAAGSVIILCMVTLATPVSVVVLGVLYGFCCGAFITLMAPLVAILTDDLSELGLRLGVSFAIEGIGGLVGTPAINGVLLTSEFVWWRPAVFSGVRR
ncbi:major facilitator superfamily domain-containing protein [Mycena capillaripes]|nr:major facilitator superfamily domain-containing protein [Mycena capillaripes]